MSKKKNTLLRNTSILMAATIISRVIGLLYRSPLGETIGNDAGIRLIAVIMTRDPHLVGTYIRNHNVFPSHHFSDII